MPTQVMAGRSQRRLTRLGLSLLLVAAAGCGLEAASPGDEAAQTGREQFDARFTVFPPPNPPLAPPEVAMPVIPQDPAALERERAARSERLSVYYVGAYE